MIYDSICDYEIFIRKKVLVMYKLFYLDLLVIYDGFYISLVNILDNLD